MTLSRFEEKILRVVQEACRMYDIEKFDSNSIDIKYTLRGKTAATAAWTGRDTWNAYKLNFNMEAIRNHWEDMFNDTIAHEVAHLICYARPELGKNHNRGWKRVAQSLGSTGNRTHRYSLTPGRKTTRHSYVLSDGRRITLGTTRHNRIHRGTHRYQSNGIRINAMDYVGVAT